MRGAEVMRNAFKEEYEVGKFIEVEYSVFGGERFGIKGEFFTDDERGSVLSPCLSRTRAEALAWCRFLTENKVLPSSLNYVLSDEFYIHTIPHTS